VVRTTSGPNLVVLRDKPTLTHHTFFTKKLIPKLDKLIDDKNIGKVREMVRDLTATTV
jgi:hypothetical protein